MVSTRNHKFVSKVTARKVGTLTYLSKYLPINLWCHFCSDYKKLRQKPKPCFLPWICQNNDNLHKRKHFEIIEYNFIEQSIELPVKKENNIKKNSRSILSVSILKDSSDDKYLCKGLMAISRSFLNSHVIDNLRSTALLLENQAFRS